ncbi:MAG: hypothetical protein UV79_C0004G0023 [candidate division TM6 bacterium GW2011_GWF2_43_17]|nr:MAG: hypothetical protein UV79_C0004G0023 [candidate division TM6 bacterium GW2011_GWF2_43_17]HAU30494.1 hypothetical protein [Candidatus Dependentiae bacterium]
MRALNKIVLTSLFLLFFQLNATNNTGDQIIQYLADISISEAKQNIRQTDSSDIVTFVSHITGSQTSVLEAITKSPSLKWYYKELLSHHYANPPVIQELVALALSFKNHEVSFCFFQELAKRITPSEQETYIKNCNLPLQSLNKNTLLKLKTISYLATPIHEKYGI